MAAFVERWWFPRAWGEAGSLTSAFYYGDAPRFVDYATAIVQGKVFDNGIPFHPPGWPLVLAAFLRVSQGITSGDVVVPVAAVKALVASLSAVSVGLATVLAYDIAGSGAMLAVALLGPFHFGHIVEGTVANSEALYGLAVTVAIWATWRWLRPDSGFEEATRVLGKGRDGKAKSRSKKERVHSLRAPANSPSRTAWAILAGAAGGFAMLVRAEFLACAVLLAGAAWWNLRRNVPARAAPLLLAALAFCAVLVPTTIWHWRTLSAFNASHVGRVAGPVPRFAPVTSYGPFNFAMANHENADGGPNRDHPLFEQCDEETNARLGAGELDLACPSVYDLYVHGYRIGLWWLVDHPGDAAALFLRKASMAIGFLAHGYLIDNVGSDVDGTRRRVDLVDPSQRWLIPIHAVLIAFGVIFLRRRPVALAVLSAPLVALAMSTLLFYGYVRLGTAYLPALWVLQGIAIMTLIERATGTRAAGAAIASSVVGAILLFVVWDGVHVNARRALVIKGATSSTGAVIQDETLEIRRASR